RRVLSCDRAADATRALHRGARAPGQRWAGTLPGLARRSPRRATHPAAEGPQAGARSAAPSGSGTPPPATLVAATDRGPARRGLSRRSAYAGVTRNDLPIPLRAGARSAACRTHAVLAHGTRAPPATATSAVPSGPDGGHGADQRTPRRGGRSGRARPLGGGSHHRQDGQLGDRHPDRAAESLRHAPQFAGGATRGTRPDRARRQDPGTPGAPPALADVGSW